MIEPTQETIESMQTAERCQLELCMADLSLALRGETTLDNVMNRFLDRYVELAI